MISIVLLGAGKVATHFYESFQASKGIEVKQWYNRSIERLKPYESQIAVTNDLTILEDADIYIISVNDDAIAQLSNDLTFENRFLVHTSGSVGLHDLDKKNVRGVFYPLQSFSDGADLNFEDVPICIESEDKSKLPLLKEIAQAINSPVYKINTEQRKVLHLCAVYVNNFTNQLYRVAHEISDAKSINFDILKPLILETAKKVQDMSPYRAQTGPALRRDKKTIKKHLKLIEKDEHKTIYELLTASIQKTHGR